MQQNEIRMIYGDRPKEMTKLLLESSGLYKMIPSGSLVGLKPNLVVGKPADSGATTHPEIVSAVVEYLQDYGHNHLLILEGSWVGDDTRRAFRNCGYEDISKRYGVTLFDTKTDKTRTCRSGDFSVEICQRALDVDYFINLPVLKGHCQTLVTGALKNLKGCISDAEKRRFHTLGLHQPIAHLGKILKSHFILVDGICGDLDFEEGGNPVHMNRIFCGMDPVLVDSFIAASMGYRPEEVRYITLAAQLGAGSCDLDQMLLTELNQDETRVSGTPSRRVSRLGAFVRQEDCCSACYANLIQALARLEDAGRISRLQGRPICIGQGFRQKKGTLGVGSCTAGMDRFAMGCPPTTAQMLAFLESEIFEFTSGKD